MFRLKDNPYDIGSFSIPIKFYEVMQHKDVIGGVKEVYKIDFILMGNIEYKQGGLYEGFNSIRTKNPLKITIASNGKVDYNYIIGINFIHEAKEMLFKILSIYLNSNNMLMHLDIDDLDARL